MELGTDTHPSAKAKFCLKF